ncbi:hypothetical protein FQA39_LY19389 [Lamprigera yunnana]|nr:hypothetical protein FQA39_LY19389 [Lamprigera yunnana]
MQFPEILVCVDHLLVFKNSATLRLFALGRRGRQSFAGPTDTKYTMDRKTIWTPWLANHWLQKETCRYANKLEIAFRAADSQFTVGVMKDEMNPKIPISQMVCSNSTLQIILILIVMPFTDYKMTGKQPVGISLMPPPRLSEEHTKADFRKEFCSDDDCYS